MRVTVYFLVRLITLYGLSAAAVQNRYYPNVQELNQIYNRFDPKELEAAYSITPIEHPFTEPSYVKHLAGFNVHETEKSQEAPEIKSYSGSEEKNSQSTWSSSGSANTVNSVRSSQEINSSRNTPVLTKTSNEDLSSATQHSSTENVSKSRKSRENYSQEKTESKLFRESSEEQQRKSSEESNFSYNRGYPSLKKEQKPSQTKLSVDSKERVSEQKKTGYSSINRKNSLPSVNSQENKRNTKFVSQMQNKDYSKEEKVLDKEAISNSVEHQKLVSEQKKTGYSSVNRKNSLPSFNSQENKRNTKFVSQMQNKDYSKEENVLDKEAMSNSVEHQKRGYQNSANYNEQKSISRETSDEYPTSKKQQYQSSAEEFKQRESQESNKQKLNNYQRMRNVLNQGTQYAGNSREEVNKNQVSNEDEDQFYQNRRELNNKNQDDNIRLWFSNHKRDHHNKQQDHRHVKRSQNLMNSQEHLSSKVENQKKQSYKKFLINSEERKTIHPVRSEVSGQQRQLNKGYSEEMQYPVSSMNNLRYDQITDDLRYERKYKQAQEYTPENRDQRMLGKYHSNEEKSKESRSSEEQRDQSYEHKKGQLYEPSEKVFRKQYSKYLVNFGEDREINAKTRSQLNRTPKYNTEFRTNSNEEYQNVMIPFAYSMHSPMPMNVRKMFMMSKSYMNNPLDFETASSDYMHGFQSSAATVQFHETLKKSMEQNENTKMNSTELITSNHYAVEEHNVTTEDGYILQIFRMSSPQNDTKKPVAFLMHGFLGSSDDWLLMGPKKSLAYLLADAGYDVWLGNARGNKYSRQHITKKPEQPEFWKFSNDEIALSDLPAMIDYALNMTQQKQMFYIGFSQGNAQFFALASSRPEYNAKIKIMYALSPMSFMKNSNSMLVKMFAPENILSEIIAKYMQSYSKTGEFKFHDKLLSLIGKENCMAAIGCNSVCSSINFIMSGVNVEQIEPEMAALILGHTPAGGSLRQMMQLGQATEDFRMFDYGIEMNQEVYGTSEPPSFNVKLVTAPVAMFSSKDDWLAATEDVEKLEAELPNVIQNYKIKNNYFTNLDFIYGKMATEMYSNIIKSMSRFEQHSLLNLV